MSPNGGHLTISRFDISDVSARSHTGWSRTQGRIYFYIKASLAAKGLVQLISHDRKSIIEINNEGNKRLEIGDEYGVKGPALETKRLGISEPIAVETIQNKK